MGLEQGTRALHLGPGAPIPQVAAGGLPLPPIVGKEAPGEWSGHPRGEGSMVGSAKAALRGRRQEHSQSEAGACGHPVRRAQVHAIALPPEVVASPGAKRDTLTENRSWQQLCACLSPPLGHSLENLDAMECGEQGGQGVSRSKCPKGPGDMGHSPLVLQAPLVWGQPKGQRNNEGQILSLPPTHTEQLPTKRVSVPSQAPRSELRAGWPPLF